MKMGTLQAPILLLPALLPAQTCIFITSCYALNALQANNGEAIAKHNKQNTRSDTHIKSGYHPPPRPKITTF